jgi:hypothetical protein
VARGAGKSFLLSNRLMPVTTRRVLAHRQKPPVLETYTLGYWATPRRVPKEASMRPRLILALLLLFPMLLFPSVCLAQGQKDSGGPSRAVPKAFE